MYSFLNTEFPFPITSLLHPLLKFMLEIESDNLNKSKLLQPSSLIEYKCNKFWITYKCMSFCQKEDSLQRTIDVRSLATAGGDQRRWYGQVPW